LPAWGHVLVAVALATGAWGLVIRFAFQLATLWSASCVSDSEEVHAAAVYASRLVSESWMIERERERYQNVIPMRRAK
jgi:hypothetical protein